MERKTHKIDATDKSPGRLASKIAVLLRGKNKPTFEKHRDMGDEVIVENVEATENTENTEEKKK